MKKKIVLFMVLLALGLGACGHDQSAEPVSGVSGVSNAPLERISWRAMAVAGDDSAPVFDNAVEEMADILAYLDAAQRRALGDRLAALVRESGYRIATGFVGTPLVTDALTNAGHLDAADLGLRLGKDFVAWRSRLLKLAPRERDVEAMARIFLEQAATLAIA